MLISSNKLFLLIVVLYPLVLIVINFSIFNHEGGIKEETERGGVTYYNEIPTRNYGSAYKKYILEPKQKLKDEALKDKAELLALQQQFQLVSTNEPKKVQCNGEEFVLEETIGAKDVQKLTTMAEQNLCLSFKQQKKFFQVKDKVIKWIHKQTRVKQKLLYGPPGKKTFAVILNEKYAFRHIYKNGGTTVSAVTKREQIKKDELGDRSLVTVVRDPIDHFLSGWAECGSRSDNIKEDKSFSPEIKLGKRLQFWLYHLEDCLSRPPKERGEKCLCGQHSYPQSNFLLNPQGGKMIDPNIEFIGDIREIHGMLQLTGLKYDQSKVPRARFARDNPLKNDKFNWDKKSLSRNTLLHICEFVILDYYLFDFKPPGICRKQVKLHIAMIEKTAL